MSLDFWNYGNGEGAWLVVAAAFFLFGLVFVVVGIKYYRLMHRTASTRDSSRFRSNAELFLGLAAIFVVSSFLVVWQVATAEQSRRDYLAEINQLAQQHDLEVVDISMGKKTLEFEGREPDCFYVVSFDRNSAGDLALVEGTYRLVTFTSLQKERPDGTIYRERCPSSPDASNEN